MAISVVLFGSAILGGVIALAIYCLKMMRLYELCSDLPGPPALPLLGNVFQFTGTKEEMMKKSMSLFDSYSPICRVWLGWHLFVGTNDPDHAKMLLVTNKMMERPFAREFLRSWMGKGLITIELEKWHQHRKLVGSAMSSSNLVNYISIFATQAEILSQRLEAHQDGAAFGVRHYFSACMFDMICESIMGLKIATQANAGSEFSNAVHKLLDIAADRFAKPWLHSDVTFNWSWAGRKHREYIDIVKRVVDDVIREKKAAIADKSQEAEGSSEKGKKSLLDTLLEPSDREDALSDDNLRDVVVTTLAAGSDSSSSMLTFVTLMLAYHPEVQDKVYSELVGIFGEQNSGEGQITSDHLNRMTYLERVIKETMRLFPIVTLLPRVVQEDMELDAYLIPKGATVFSAIIMLHRNEKFWPDPLKFDPDRFLPEEVAQRHRYAYIPFGLGPRNCIGSKYAMMVMKIICASLVRKYVMKKDNIVPIKDIRLVPGLILTLAEKEPIRIERRTEHCHQTREASQYATR